MNLDKHLSRFRTYFFFLFLGGTEAVINDTRNESNRRAHVFAIDYGDLDAPPRAIKTSVPESTHQPIHNSKPFLVLCLCVSKANERARGCLAAADQAATADQAASAGNVIKALIFLSVTV